MDDNESIDKRFLCILLYASIINAPDEASAKTFFEDYINDGWDEALETDYGGRIVCWEIHG